MMRTLRILAVLSVVWSVGFFLLPVTDVLSGATFFLPLATPSFVSSFVSSLGGELGFAVGILALVATASRRRFAWFTLFALLLVLLYLLPLVIVVTFKIPGNFLTSFEAPLAVFGRFEWVVVLPALLPGVACLYTLMVSDGRPRVAGGSGNRAG